MAKINTNKPKHNNINPSFPKSVVVVDLRYLHHSKMCLKNVFNELRKRSDDGRSFYDLFQRFIYEFSTCSNIGDAIKNYSSHKSGRKVTSKTIENIINLIPESNIKEVALKDYTHIHLKRYGEGKEIVWGFPDNNNTFYLLAIDIKHETI